MIRRNKGFTLVEVLAVIIILMVLIAISIPIISNIIESSRKGAFSNSLKLIVNRAIALEAKDHTIDFYTINETNIENLMGIDVTNYETLSFEKEDDGDFFATILGKNKFEGFVACGSEDVTYVEEVGKEAYCYVPTTCYLPNNPDTEESCFVFNEETNTITGYNSDCTKDLGIPETINGKDVINIGSYAFASMNLSTVSFPATLKNIGYEAFVSNQLYGVNFPDGLEIIGESAFANNIINCARFPNSLKTIDRLSFSGNQLNSIITPVYLEKIGEMAFQMNPIKYARINGGIIDNYAFSTTQIEKIDFGPKVSYVGINTFTGSFLKNDLIIPASLSVIGRYNFHWDCLSNNLEYDIIIKNGFTFSDYNFYTCSNHIINNFIVESGYLQNPHTIKGKINNLVFGENVKEIGVSLSGSYFGSQLEIEKLVISATKIGVKEQWNGVFSSKNLKNLILKEGVREIGWGAFSNGNFKELAIPDSVVFLGNQSFTAGNIEKIQFGSGLKEINEMAFYVNHITSLTLPSNIEKVGRLAFYSNQINKLNLKEGLEMIDGYAFSSNQIEDIVIPSTVMEIGNYAFENNPIKSVTILGNPNRFNDRWTLIGFPITLIPGFEPDMCYEVNSGVITKYYYGCNITDLVIPSVISGQTIVGIDSSAFVNLKINKLTIPSTIVTIADNSFTYNNQPNLYIKELIIEGNSNRFNDNWTSIGFPLPLKSDYTNEMCFTFNNGEISNYNISCSKDVVIPETINDISVISIGSAAFYDKGIKSLVLPNTLQNISYRAFANNYLKTISLPSSLNYIGSEAFQSNLITNVTFPSTIGYIDGYAFAYNQITSLTLPDNINSIAAGTFADNQIQTLNLPSNLGNIENYAFKNNQIINLVLPNNLSNIGIYAFQNNQIINLVLPNNLSNIGNYAFQNNQIQTLNLPSSLGNIGNYAFQNNQITSLNFQGDDIAIREYAFQNNQITNLVLPSDGSVGSYAFENNLITSLTLPTSSSYYSSTINSYAYANNKITNLVIPDNITEINSGAFSNNKISNLTIPATVRIYDRAFLSNEFTSIIIYGDQYRFNDKWGNIGFPTNLMPIPYYTCFDFEDGYINGYDESCRRNVTIPEMINGVKVIGIGDYAFSGENITDIDIPATITYIGSQAFNDNKLPDNKAFIYGRNPDGSVNKKVLVSYGGIKRTNVIVPEGIETINEYAFAGMGLSGTITLPSSLKTINMGSFISNQIGSIVIPESNNLTRIEDYAFMTNVLNSVVIPNSVTYVGVNAFAENQLVNLTLSQNLETIKNFSFGNNQIISLIIPNSVTTIESVAFMYSPLTELTLSNNLTYIGSAAFLGNQIEELTIPASVVTIDGGAFQMNIGFSSITVQGTPITRFNDNWTGIGFPAELMPLE